MTPPMTPPSSPPKLPPIDSPLVASPKMVDGQIISKGNAPNAPLVDRRTDEEKRKDLQASRVFQSLYLSPDH